MPSAPRQPAPVALVTLADPAGAGGVPRVLDLLAAGLGRRGHDVTLCAWPLAIAPPRTILRRAWRRIDPSWEEVRRIRRALSDLTARVEDTSPGTVCIAFEAWTAAACVDAGRPTIYRVAGVGSITDEWVRNGFVDEGSRHVGWLRAQERRGFERADRIVVLGEAGARAIEGLGADPAQVVAIPNGIDLPTLPEPRQTGPGLTIVCTANLRHVKGVDILAEALARLPDDVRHGTRLLHFGAGREAGNATYETAHARLTATDVEHEFRGARPNVEVRETLLGADLFVLPSRVEMFPNALLEAMAAGLPAVGTDVGAVPEVLGHAAHADGLVVAPGDAAALSAAIERLARDPALRERHGLLNRRRVKEHFTLPAVVERYAALVEEVARASVG